MSVLQTNKRIVDLKTDFSDGLLLLALIEKLTGKKFKTINRDPKLRTHKLENVTTALTFLEQEAGVKIINIGPFLIKYFLIFMAFFPNYSFYIFSTFCLTLVKFVHLLIVN